MSMEYIYGFVVHRQNSKPLTFGVCRVHSVDNNDRNKKWIGSTVTIQKDFASAA